MKRERGKRECITIAASYCNDWDEGLRIKAYLERSGLIANRYLKDLIKADLDSKGFMMDCDCD